METLRVEETDGGGGSSLGVVGTAVDVVAVVMRESDQTG